MQTILYFFFRSVVWLVSITPFRVLYFFSDVTYYIFYYLLKYRKRVVFDNLKSSFPQKTSEETEVLMRRFYRFFCDLIFESLKGMSLTKKQLEARHKLVNPEVINALLADRRSVLGVTAHYGNWEWGALSGAAHFKAKMVAFYKPISNKIIDRFMISHRARFNCHLAAVGDTLFTIRHYQKEVVTYFMVADQSPSNLRRSYWFDFLNRDTPFIHGPEEYSRLYNLPVVFIDIRRVKRGYYEVYFSLLTDNPSALPKGEITRLYKDKLEEMITREPAYWLWSHRRWKRKRSDIRVKGQKLNINNVE